MLVNGCQLSEKVPSSVASKVGFDENRMTLFECGYGRGGNGITWW